MSKRRRGTAIVDTPDGILILIERGGDLALLPGGGAERGESRMQAAIRELKEETGLEPYLAVPLFRFASAFSDHSVFYIRAAGTPQLTSHSRAIGYYRIGRVTTLACQTETAVIAASQVSKGTRAIITLYRQMRRDRPDFFAAIDNIPGIRQYSHADVE
ncbi:MAG: hypothetical protein FOGNACKC_01990 [Anaerolineae bacterium]|nr:hypothetical protein [Anaerolineae bacterium]